MLPPLECVSRVLAQPDTVIVFTALMEDVLDLSGVASTLLVDCCACGCRLPEKVATEDLERREGACTAQLFFVP